MDPKRFEGSRRRLYVLMGLHLAVVLDIIKSPARDVIVLPIAVWPPLANDERPLGQYEIRLKRLDQDVGLDPSEDTASRIKVRSNRAVAKGERFPPLPVPLAKEIDRLEVPPRTKTK